MVSDPFLSDLSKKRKRTAKPTSIRKSTKTSTSKTHPRSQTHSNSNSSNKKITSNSNNTNKNDKHDEEISEGSDSEDEQGNVSVGSNDEDALNESDELSSDEEFSHENAADKRRRLAKQYLENLKTEANGEYDYDAQDLDDEIVASRLQKDVAETKGWVYKFFASDLESQIDDLKHTTTRIGSKSLTSVSVCYPYLYTVSKDMELIKWDISKICSTNKKPVRIRHVKGGSRFKELDNDPSKNGHCDEILCVAASPDGRFVVTGGRDKRLIIWSTEQLSALKVIDTRSQVLSMDFRRGTDQLYASCSDLKIRTFAINQFAQLEVLFGHQDVISDISALSKETCVSVGSRDKTAMFWKISEETRLTFRGGDGERKKKFKRKTDDTQEIEEEKFYAEGSIDCVSMIDDSHFVTGSDNGNISLWSLAKKKPIFTQRIAHGLQPELTSNEASAEVDNTNATLQIPNQNPYWITSVYALPYSNIFVSGSWDEKIKFWKLGEQLRSFELIGSISNIKGCVTKIVGLNLEEDRKIEIFAIVSKEHKFGRWLKMEGGRNCLVSCTFDTSSS